MVVLYTIGQVYELPVRENLIIVAPLVVAAFGLGFDGYRRAKRKNRKAQARNWAITPDGVQLSSSRSNGVISVSHPGASVRSPSRTRIGCYAPTGIPCGGRSAISTTGTPPFLKNSPQAVTTAYDPKRRLRENHIGDRPAGLLHSAVSTPDAFTGFGAQSGVRFPAPPCILSRRGRWRTGIVMAVSLLAGSTACVKASRAIQCSASAAALQSVSGRLDSHSPAPGEY